MNYDIFISCKSTDYVLAEELYTYLKSQGFNIFLSNMELRRMKDSEYMDAISAALDSAHHLIVLTSSSENVLSKWVKFEWTTFLNETLSGRKVGQIITVLHNMPVSNLPIQLRHYESFTMEDYNDRIVPYLETPAYLERKEQASKKALLEAEKLRKENEEKQRREILKQEIEDGTLEYQRYATNLESKAQQIIEKQSLLGVVEKKCPVCNKTVALKSKYCDRCGWTFVPEFEATPKGNKDQIFLMQSNWRAANNSSKVSKKSSDKQSAKKDSEIASLQNELVTIKAGFKKVQTECRTYWLHRVSDLKSEVKRLRWLIVSIVGILAVVGGIISYRVFYHPARIKIGDVTYNMVFVKGGTFQMGATSEQGSEAAIYEKPVHSVTLGNYMIGQTEVTQELWEAVMGSNPSRYKGTKNPVGCVSWNDCQEFIKKLNEITGQNYRLPTEAEWEYAARGGNKSKGYKYSGSNNIDDVAWHWKNSGDAYLIGTDEDWSDEKVKSNNSTTHQVASKAPNELGLYDMSGNVAEWCQDWYGLYHDNAQINPQGPDTGSYRVVRGGSIYNIVSSCRSSRRGTADSEKRYWNYGLRLAISE